MDLTTSTCGATTLLVPVVLLLIGQEWWTEYLKRLSMPIKTIVALVALFGLAAVAILFPHSKWAKRAFVGCFFVLLLTPAFVTAIGGPFVSWGIFPNPGPEELSIQEVVVVDDDGTELRYDARALGPVTSTRLRRYGGFLAGGATAPSSPECRLGVYFLQRAEAYRAYRAAGPSWFDYVQFPRHQLGYKWSDAAVAGLEEIRLIRVYTVNATIEPDGSDHTITSRTLDYEVATTETNRTGYTCRS